MKHLSAYIAPLAVALVGYVVGYLHCAIRHCTPPDPRNIGLSGRYHGWGGTPPPLPPQRPKDCV